MTRISLDPPRTLLMRVGEWYSRWRFGRVLDPARAYGHNPRILRDYVALERKIERWRSLDARLKHLAVMGVAARIGCAWCIDFGYWEARELGLDAAKVRKVPAWREHGSAFTDLERLVLEYAECMTETPPTVSDELAAELRGRLGEAAFVELTAIVAVENLRARGNHAFGLQAQGFSDSCEIPPS